MFEPKIKICGITNLEDANAAVDMGADILGFIFYDKSPRYVEPEMVAKIVEKLPTTTGFAGVFVNEEISTIKAIAEMCDLNWIQVHGDEQPEYFEPFQYTNVRTIKSIRVKTISDLEKVNKYPVDAVLLDSYTKGEYGGTGQTFDWNMLKDVLAYIDKRLILSGGINASNVREAYEMGLYGIDISSGVETSPGKKDHEKMRKLFEMIHH